MKDAPHFTAKRIAGAIHWSALLPYLLVVSLLGLLGLASVDILSSARAYVGGESLWSKAQKDANGRLADYIRTGDERHHTAMIEALAVPDGDRRARLALDREPPDREAAREGFIAGGNDPADIAGMIRLYRNFRDLPFMAAAISLWAEGDVQLAELRVLADEVHRAGPAMGAAQRRGFAQRAAVLDERTSALASRFSEQLGEASRTTRTILASATFGIALVLAVMGALFVQRALERLAASERSLRANIQRWDLAASGSGIGVFEWDTRLDQVLLDARALALHGLRGDAQAQAQVQVPLQRLYETVHPEDRERVDASGREARQRNDGTWTERYRVVLADGTVRHVETVARRAAPSAPMVGVIRDVSDAHNAEQLRLDMLAAERSSAAKTAFLSRASHELRTPLNAVLGFAQMMRMDRAEPLGAEQMRRVRQIERGGENLVRLINNLLDLSALDQGEFTPQWQDMNVAELLARSAARIEPLRIARKASISVLPGTEPVRVHTDARAAEQIFANLLGNAVQHGPEGGDVNADVEIHEGEVIIAISDRGPGLTATQIEQLFQPFARVGAEYGNVDGAGLGLVVSRRLADRIDASIELRSTPGRGTTVRVRMPRSLPVNTLAEAERPSEATSASR